MVRQVPALRVNLFLEIQAIRGEAAAHVEPGHPEHGTALAEPAEDDQPTGAEQPALARPPMKQLNIVVGLSRIREYEPAGPETEKCFNALLTMIAADGQPDSIVEKPGFIHFSEQLRPRYHLRTRMTCREKNETPVPNGQNSGGNRNQRCQKHQRNNGRCNFAAVSKVFLGGYRALDGTRKDYVDCVGCTAVERCRYMCQLCQKSQ